VCSSDLEWLPQSIINNKGKKTMTELEKCMAGEWYDCHDPVFLEF